MSIINEALRKAQKENVSSSLIGQENIRKNVQAEFLRRKQGMNWGPIFVLLVLFLITAPIVTPLFSSPFKKVRWTKTTSTQKMSASQNIPMNADMTLSGLTSKAGLTGRKAQFAIEETPVTQGVPPPPLSQLLNKPSLLLTGIVYSSDTESYCILNDKIIKVGQEVDGARVVSVGADKVRLDYRGETIELPVAQL